MPVTSDVMARLARSARTRTPEGRGNGWARASAHGAEVAARRARMMGHDGSSIARGPDTTAKDRHTLTRCPRCQEWVTGDQLADHGGRHRVADDGKGLIGSRWETTSGYQYAVTSVEHDEAIRLQGDDDEHRVLWTTRHHLAQGLGIRLLEEGHTDA